MMKVVLIILKMLCIVDVSNVLTTMIRTLLFKDEVTWLPEVDRPLRFTDFTVVTTEDQPDRDLCTNIALEDNATDYYNVEADVQEGDVYMNVQEANKVGFID